MSRNIKYNSDENGIGWILANGNSPENSEETVEIRERERDRERDVLKVTGVSSVTEGTEYNPKCMLFLFTSFAGGNWETEITNDACTVHSDSHLKKMNPFPDNAKKLQICKPITSKVGGRRQRY